MKRAISTAVALLSLALAAASFAEEKGKGGSDYASAAYAPRGPLGLGLYLGKPAGVTGKYFFDDYSAIAATLAFDFWENSFNLQADYQFHFRKILMVGKEEIIPYLGVGGYFGISSAVPDDILWAGARFPLGASYQMRTFPLEIGFEVVPSYEFLPASRFILNGGLTLRYYFLPGGGREAKAEPEKPDTKAEKGKTGKK
jgi:hypothetical protein